jgi:hypothetical protein
LPGRPVGGALAASYAYVPLPNSETADPNQSFSQNLVNASAEFAIQPGGGTLDWRFGYLFSGAFFDTTAGDPLSNYTNQAFTRGRWRFGPRTAFLYDASLGFQTYENEQKANSLGLVDSTPVRARIGVNGLITERFAALAEVGWGSSFIRTGPNPKVPQFDSIIGQAELKWFLAAAPGVSDANELGLSLSSISLGFTRDFTNSYISNFYALDRGYLKFQYFFAGRFVSGIEGGVAAVEYPDSYWMVPVSFRHASFTDVRADASVFGEYRFTSWFGINATFRYTQNFSNVTLDSTNPANLAAGATNPQYGMGWQRFEAFGGARLFF